MDRLKELRLTAGMSQAEVAAKLGITQQAYANYERGARQADYNTLISLSNIFETSTDYLLGVSNTHPNKTSIIAVSLITLHQNMHTTIIPHAIRSMEKIIGYKNAHNKKTLFKSDIILKHNKNRIVIAVEYNQTVLLHSLYYFFEMLSSFQTYSLMEDHVLLSGTVFIGSLNTEPIFTPCYPRLLIDNSIMEVINHLDNKNLKYNFFKYIRQDKDKKNFLNYLAHTLPWEHSGINTGRYFLNSDLHDMIMFAENKGNTSQQDILQSLYWIKDYHESFYREHNIDLNISSDTFDIAAWDSEGNEGKLPHPDGDVN